MSEAAAIMTGWASGEFDGMAIALLRIAEEAECRTGVLDLRGLGLEELPEALFDLTHLRELDVSTFFPDHLRRNRVNAQRQLLARLIRLEKLAVGSSDLASLDFAKTLSSLQSLECYNTQVSDLSPLSGLAGLQSLFCGGTQVSDLSPLSGHAGLQSLDCSHTQVRDLSPLSGLAGLQSLSCYSTEVRDLSPLSGLAGLQSLDCSYTEVRDLSSLAGLNGLQSLDCSGTQVSDLSPLSGLNGLQSLNCSFCRLISVPLDILALPSLKHLCLYEAVIPGLPPGVLSTDFTDNCLDRLRAHFADLATEAAEMPGVKLLLLGNGGAGKTKIAGWLSGKDYGPDRWDSTHGIEIGETDLPGEPATRLQIWDFGGQDIYHGAHALFLRSPAVLAAVWATDTEANKSHVYGGLEFRNQPLAYWVEIARHQGHPDSPLLILQSKCDTAADEVHRLPLDDGQRCFKSLQVSAKKNRYKGALLDTLSEAVKHLRDPSRMGMVKIGAGRLRVRERLEAMRAADRALPPDRRRHRLLTLAEFERICTEEGGVSSPDHLLTWLDADGTVLYRPGLLRDRIVLDQNWALEAVYAVFHRDSGLLSEIRRSNGRFTLALLGRFVWQNHGEEDRALFLDLMRSCGICFKHREFKLGGETIVEYIAPDLLPERDAVAGRLPVFWDEERAGEQAVFRYPLLHDGLIRTIVADLGEQAGPDALYWRGGLCGFEARTGSRFRIEMQRPDPDSWPGEIHVRTQGDRAAELLVRLVRHVESAQSRFGLRAETVEPLMKVSMEDKQDMSFAPPPSPPATADQWYVSYAWGDETDEGKAREGIVDDLCAAAGQRGRVILRDKNVLSLGASILEFMGDIGAGKRVFIILSDKYLHSPFCMFELSEIWRTSLREKTFLDRVRVYALPDAKIWNSRDRVMLAIHWKQEYDFLDSQAREHGPTILGEFEHRQLRLMQFFYTQVADILGAITSRVQPRTFEELKAYGLDDRPG